MSNILQNPDTYTGHLEEMFEGTYDCVDRFVLNAYNYPAQSGGGFRIWWRKFQGDDHDLDNTHLMKYAGRFSRRIRAFAKKRNIPVIDCKRRDRKDEIAAEYIPEDPNFKGVFLILTGRAQGMIRSVEKSSNGQIHITAKLSYVKLYHIHIIDRNWGHIIIRYNPHPPFNAQIIFNGHEWLAVKAAKCGIEFTKEDNCFTHVSNPAAFAKIADTMKASSFVGQLAKVCERWIYSACLAFSLGIDVKDFTHFHYGYSVYQGEYSRNLIFKCGREMMEVFNATIDRTRAPLDIKTIRTIFSGKKKFHYSKNKKIECTIEKRDNGLIVFKINFGKLTAKMYNKGERVLRIETIAHNTDALKLGKMIGKFPDIIESLNMILNNFLSCIHSIDHSFIDNEFFQNLHTPSRWGKTRVSGIDINNPRMQAVMQAIISLSTKPFGFSLSDIAEQVRGILGFDNQEYSNRKASYDVKKFKAKDLVQKIKRSRRFEVEPSALRSMAALIILRDKVIIPLISGINSIDKRHRETQPAKTKAAKAKAHASIDDHYRTLRVHMLETFETLGIAV